MSHPVSREPLCQVSFCPAPTDPDFHRCIRCNKIAVEHHHVYPRSLAPNRKNDPTNIAMLCPEHHREVTEGPYSDYLQNLPGHGLTYWVLDAHGKTVFERVLSRGEEEVRKEETEGRADEPQHPALLAPAQGLPADVESALTAFTVRQPSAAVITPGYTETALSLPQMEYQRWHEIGVNLGRMRKACQWWVGDWLIYGEDAFGEECWQAVEEIGLRFEAVSNWLWVARSVTPERRRADLSWSHHREIADLPPDGQATWLQRAIDGGLSAAELGRLLKDKPAKPIYECLGCGREGELTEVVKRK